MLEHGGRLRQAAARYGIPLENWLDLSTGINPNGWAPPALPAECWRRLPEDDDGLLPAARDYYQNSAILPVAGSQAAIQLLPLLRPSCRVGVLHPAYAEHAEAWRKAGHAVRILESNAIDAGLDRIDVLMIINPNNPTGVLFEPQRLLEWHGRLSRKGGWLIVDEAFIDCTPEYSLSPLLVQSGLIVLRSIGKFFGLAGIRCGFVIAEPELLNVMAERLGPWSISHVSRYVAGKALVDLDWQRVMAIELENQGRRLRTLLADNGLPPDGGCALFQWLRHERAAVLQDLLARRGILTRLFESPASLRFGLPGDELEWGRLGEALAVIETGRLADLAL